MLRDKDKELARSCATLADCSLEALAWANDNPEAAGVKQPALVKALRKHAVDLRKLALAASRPMSVAVFGASQAGKSYLVGSFISPRTRPVKVRFADQAGETHTLDFLDDVNPQGGKETTGIVTRFSTQPMEGGPKGFPVILRVLREIDIVKILANTHMLDLKCGWEDGLAFDPLHHAATIEALPRTPGAPGLTVEAVYELRDYVEAHLRFHPLARPEAEPYWTALERIGPSLGAAGRVAAFAPFWGELKEFADLFATLKAALDDLKHPAWMYTPLDAILDRSYGVLHAETLYALDPAYVAGLEGPGRARTALTTVAGDTGVRIDLPRPVVTALAAELRVTLDARPWDFLEHTDLLDFPGAKSREDAEVATFLRRGDRTHARAYCFLRGKVAVLFDNYVDDLEANALVLAVDDSQGEVKKLGQLVEDWVRRSHGATPRQRAEVTPVSLFFTLMKGDTLFKLDRNSDAGESVRNRLAQNLANYPGWTTEWTPGQSFNNVFLFRNVSFYQPGIIEYDGPWPTAENAVGELPVERDYTSDFRGRREAFRDAFLAERLVQVHVADAGRRFDALLELNDGGISCLAHALRPVCDLDLKARQIEPVRQRLRTALIELLSEYHESSDLARREAERLARIREVIDAIQTNAELLGPFIRQFHVQPVTQARLYLDFTTQHRGPGGRSTSGERSSALRRGLQREAQVPAAPQGGFGAFALAAWRESLSALSRDDALSRGFHLTPEKFASVMQELLGYATLSGLEGSINAAVAAIEATPRRPDEISARVGMTTAKLINEAVSELGAPPRAHLSDAPKYPDLGDDRTGLEDTRMQPFVRWVLQLETATSANVRGGQGARLPAEQNRRLGSLLERIGGQ